MHTIIKKPRVYESPNLDTTHVYTGTHYVLNAEGGFSLSNDILYTKTKIETIEGLSKRDTSNALQILFPADIINKSIIDDTVRISAQIFKTAITKENIIYEGNMKDICEEYLKQVNRDMGHTFQTFLYRKKMEITKENIYSIISDNLKGEFHMLDVKNTLYRIYRLNAFGNRNQEGMILTSPKFMPGDLIYIEKGIELNLAVDLNYDKGIYELLKTKLGTSTNIIQDSTALFEHSYNTPVLLRLI